MELSVRVCGQQNGSECVGIENACPTYHDAGEGRTGLKWPTTRGRVPVISPP